LYFVVKSYIGILTGTDVSKTDSKKSLSDNYAYESLPDISVVAGAGAAGVLIEINHRLELSVAKASWDSQSSDMNTSLPYAMERKTQQYIGQEPCPVEEIQETINRTSPEISESCTPTKISPAGSKTTPSPTSNTSTTLKSTGSVSKKSSPTGKLLHSLSKLHRKKKGSRKLSPKSSDSSAKEHSTNEPRRIDFGDSASVSHDEIVVTFTQSLSSSSSTEHSRKALPSPENTITPPVTKLATEHFGSSVNGKETLDRINIFLEKLDKLCDNVERSLVKTLPERLTGYVFANGSKGKLSDIRNATEALRTGLKKMHHSGQQNADAAKQESVVFPFVDVIHSDRHFSHLVTGLDWSSSYILPSAHFPLLVGVTATRDLSHVLSSDSALDIANKRDCLLTTTVSLQEFCCVCNFVILEETN
jgi:hypothetical protein